MSTACVTLTSDPGELAEQLLKKVVHGAADDDELLNKLIGDERLSKIAEFLATNTPSVLQGQPAFAKCVQLFTKDIYIYIHI
jgi:uncharacterized protein (UPF0218 family)